MQAYGFAGAALAILYFFDISLSWNLVIIFIIPTLIEFIIGYSYFKTKKIRLWDYSREKFNLMGIICLRFSLVWFIVSAAYYYMLLPKL